MFAYHLQATTYNLLMFAYQGLRKSYSQAKRIGTSASVIPQYQYLFYTFCPNLFNGGIHKNRAPAKQSLLCWPCSESSPVGSHQNLGSNRYLTCTQVRTANPLTGFPWLWHGWNMLQSLLPTATIPITHQEVYNHWAVSTCHSSNPMEQFHPWPKMIL